jgi:hypothetical protein
MSRFRAVLLLVMLVMTGAMGLKAAVTARGGNAVILANGGAPAPSPWKNGGAPAPSPWKNGGAPAPSPW